MIRHANGTEAIGGSQHKVQNQYKLECNTRTCTSQHHVNLVGVGINTMTLY